MTTDPQARAAEVAAMALHECLCADDDCDGGDMGSYEQDAAHVASALAAEGLLVDLDTIRTLSAAYREAIGVPESEHQRRRMESMATALEAARAELAEVRFERDGFRAEISRLAARLQIEKPEAERRGAVAALREAARHLDLSYCYLPLASGRVSAECRNAEFNAETWLRARADRIEKGDDDD